MQLSRSITNVRSEVAPLRFIHRDLKETIRLSVNTVYLSEKVTVASVLALLKLDNLAAADKWW